MYIWPLLSDNKVFLVIFGRRHTYKWRWHWKIVNKINRNSKNKYRKNQNIDFSFGSVRGHLSRKYSHFWEEGGVEERLASIFLEFSEKYCGVFFGWKPDSETKTKRKKNTKPKRTILFSANLIKSNRNQIVFAVFRLIWNQTDVCLVPNQSVNSIYNLISVESEVDLSVCELQRQMPGSS